MRPARCLTAAVVAAAILLAMASPALAFSDTRNHWAHPAIEHLKTREILGGYPDGRFRPDQPVTRAEMAHMLCSFLGKEDQALVLVQGKSSFLDVDNTYWAMGSIEVLWELGIAKGDGQGRFWPKRFLTRADASTLLVRALGIGPSEQYQLVSQYSDWTEIPQYAKGYMEQATRLGIMTGFPDGTIRPNADITRGEMATILERAYDILGDRFQMMGRLDEYDAALNRVRIAVNGENMWFGLASGCVILHDNVISTIQGIDPPFQVYFDLDDSGKITYLRAMDGASGSAVPTIIEERMGLSQAVASSTQSLMFGADEKGSPLATPDSHPELSLSNAKREMSVESLIKRTGADGRGVVVSIIDSGVDPSHPDLARTTGGTNKISDFIDLTNEGQVLLSTAVQTNTYVSSDGTQVRLANLRSRSGRTRIGYWDESVYPSGSAASDLNCNRVFGERILVAAADQAKAGVYDTVYIDVDGDGQVDDEKPLHLFSTSHEVGKFSGSGGRSFGFVVCSLAADGSYVKFGFDGNGHGTHIAGIVGANGDIQGLAPGSRLLVIKVADSSGATDRNALKKAVELAAQRGAAVANISLGFAGTSYSGASDLAETINKMSISYGTVYCVAAGNLGPGLASMTDPGFADRALRIGAYMTPEQWRVDYGWTTSVPTVWYYSSSGPRQDGAAGPNLIAPGSAISTYPLWSGQKYQLNEGTSMSSAYCAGAVAVVIDALNRRYVKPDPEVVKRAFQLAAQPLSGYDYNEQGEGTVNAEAAYDVYSSINSLPQLQSKSYSPGYGVGTGMYSRGLLPGVLPLTVNNVSQRGVYLSLSSTLAGLASLPHLLQVPAANSRKFEVCYSIPDEPGLYSGLIVGDDPLTYGWDLKIPQTVIVPYDLGTGHEVREQGNLGAGNIKRYFVLVPPGTGKLNVTVNLSKNKDGKYEGRVRVFLYGPSGNQASISPYAGCGPLGSHETGEVKVVEENPQQGVWEIDVYSSVTLSLYGCNQSKYSISMSVAGSGNIPSRIIDDYLVTSVPGLMDDGYLTFNIRDRKTLQPYQGAVEADGLLYWVEDGKLRLSKQQVGEQLVLRWR